MELQTNENWQTQQRGTLEDEYNNYVALATAMGWVVKDFEEWLGA